MISSFGWVFGTRLVKSTVLIILIIVLLSLAVVLVDIMPELALTNLSWQYVESMLVLHTLHFLLPIIPIVFSLGLLLTLVHFINTQEYLAAITLGLSYKRRLGWCLAWALVASGLCYWMVQSIPSLSKSWNLQQQQQVVLMSEIDLPAYNIQKVKKDVIITTSKPVSKGKYQHIWLVNVKSLTPLSLQVWQAHKASYAVHKNHQSWQLLDGNIYKLGDNKRDFNIVKFQRLTYLANAISNKFHLDKMSEYSLAKLLALKSVVGRLQWQQRVDSIIMNFSLILLAFLTLPIRSRQNSSYQFVPLLVIVLVYLGVNKVLSAWFIEMNDLNYSWVLFLPHIIAGIVIGFKLYWFRLCR